MSSSTRGVSNSDFKSIRTLSAASIVLALLIGGSLAQDIVFPDEHGRDSKRPISTTEIVNETSTEPVITCNVNMILVSINETENFCECLKGYLYHLKTDMCYTPYTRGPCNEDEHFVLSANKTKTECVKNPCETNKVPYKGMCYDLLEYGGPCKHNETLAISQDFNEPRCEIPGALVQYHVVDIPLKPCAPGSRRDGMDPRCRTIY